MKIAIELDDAQWQEVADLVAKALKEANLYATHGSWPFKRTEGRERAKQLRPIKQAIAAQRREGRKGK